MTQQMQDDPIETSIIQALEKIQLDVDVDVDSSPLTILCDLGYGVPIQPRPRKEKILAMAKQIVNFLEWQQAQSLHRATLWIVECPDDVKAPLQSRMEQLWKQKQTTGATNFPSNLQFTDTPIKSFQNAIYLSPDAETALDPLQPPSHSPLVVGMLIDRRIQPNRSLRRAQHLQLPTARLPLTSVDANEPLNVDCILELLQQWCWNCNSHVNGKNGWEQAVTQALSHHQQRHPKRPFHRIKPP